MHRTAPMKWETERTQGKKQIKGNLIRRVIPIAAYE